LAPQYQAISATDRTAEPMMTFNLRKFRLPHRRSAVVEVKDSLQGFGFNVTEYRVAIVDGKWRVRSKRLTICGSG
jgi:hypothetical protein